MSRAGRQSATISLATLTTFKVLAVTTAVCCYVGLAMGGPGDAVCFIVFVCATISSIAGFAFSAIAGAMLHHVVRDPVEAVQVMLVASIAVQAYGVWALRERLNPRELAPYFAGGVCTVAPGIFLLLHTPVAAFTLALSAFLIVYGAYMLLRSPLRLQGNSLAGRLLVGALGGISGATAAFPGAFITVWCAAHGWDKHHQRAIYQPYILGMQIITLVVLMVLAPPPQLRLDLLKYVAPALLGSYLGLAVFGKLNATQFNKVVSVFLVLSGAAMACRAL